MEATPVPPQEKLRPGDRAEIIQRSVEKLEQLYVFPEVARKMADAISADLKAGRFDGIEDPQEFGAALTARMQTVSKDLHLRVSCRAEASRPSGPGSGSRISGERLDGNIGYLRLDGFPPAERLAPQLDPIMKTLSTTDAMIIDLRENRGGSPGGVMYLAGYLFAETTLVARIYSRPENGTTEMWTEAVPGPKYLEKPVYVLTGRTTFSAAEAAAYHLKHLGRAKTVGERSGGGAHRVQDTDLGHGCSMAVPFTRPINVVTGSDWEGTGVEVDIPAAPADTLYVAQKEALRRLPKTAERDAALQRLDASRR